MLTRPQIIIAAVLATGALLLASQFRPGRSVSQPPAADLSTPERALKSYWTLREWVRRTQSADPKSAATPLTMAEAMSAVTSPSMRDSFLTRPGAVDPLGWSLERIDQVSEQRAVATARIRNLARNPALVTPTPIELFEPNLDNQIEYVLHKDGAAWKVTEVWRVDAQGKRNRVR
jgi:hypothetical protein